MKRIVIPAVAFLLMASLLCGPLDADLQGPLSEDLQGPLVEDLKGQTLDDVLAMYYQAHGGLDKLKAVTAVKMSGRLAVPAQGLDLPMVRWQQAPDRLRVETVFQDSKVIQGTDGRTAWWLNPMLAPEAREMPEEQARPFREQAEFANPLVAYKEKGYKLELVGREELEGKPAYLLKLTRGDGREVLFYLDAASGLGLKSTHVMRPAGDATLVEIIYGDYRKVEGQLVPFSIENRVAGKTRARLVLETVEFNPAVSPAFFAMPGKNETPDKKEAPGKRKAPGKKDAPARKGGE